MRELAQKNQKTGRRRLAFAGVLAMLQSIFLPRTTAGLQSPYSGQNRAYHKAERQRVRYARTTAREATYELKDGQEDQAVESAPMAQGFQGIREDDAGAAVEGALVFRLVRCGQEGHEVNELAYYTERLREGVMDWMLTDEETRDEIDKAMREYAAKAPAVDWPVWRNHAIARAAARSVAKWLLGPCKEHHLNNSTPPLRIDCYICRKDMEEVGL